MTRYILGIDQGTTGTFVSLMNEAGDRIGQGDKAHRQMYPQAGWVEQDPDELWQNARDLINTVIRDAQIQASEIAGIGIANQGESVMMWDRQTGQPIYNVLVWQDTRTQEFIDQLATDQPLSQDVAQRTGLKLDSYFSAGKIRWLLDHVPEARDLLKQGRLLCGTLDTWLIWKLTQGAAFVTDASTASRTLLFNIHTLEWDQSLLDLFDIPREILAQVRPSSGDFGVVSHPDLLCLGVPIAASLVDQPAAMIGHGCLHPGQIKATYGTGCFINLNTGSRVAMSRYGLLTVLAWHGETVTYGLEGGVFTAAASINWLRDKLGLLPTAASLDELCSLAEDSGGALWIPAQVGLGAPYWQRSIRGAWLGLDLSTSKAQLVRAVLEGIAANVAQIVQTMMDDTSLTISSLRVDGGLTASTMMMQIQADLLGCPVEVVANPEATVSGVSALAARATGLWSSDEMILQRMQIGQTYFPRLSEDRRKAHMERFNEAIEHLKAWQNHA
jgi:glycerol kinase